MKVWVLFRSKILKDETDELPAEKSCYWTSWCTMVTDRRREIGVRKEHWKETWKWKREEQRVMGEWDKMRDRVSTSFVTLMFYLQIYRYKSHGVITLRQTHQSKAPVSILSHTHTHTRTHARTHAHAHPHTHTHSHMCTCAWTNTQMSGCWCTVDMLECRCWCVWTQTQTHTLCVIGL